MIKAPVDHAPHGPCHMLYDPVRRLRAWVDCNAHPLRVRSWPCGGSPTGMRWMPFLPACAAALWISGWVAPSGGSPREAVGIVCGPVSGVPTPRVCGIHITRDRGHIDGEAEEVGEANDVPELRCLLEGLSLG